MKVGLAKAPSGSKKLMQTVVNIDRILHGQKL